MTEQGTEIDQPFVWAMNQLLPPMIHTLAFHPASPLGTRMLRDLSGHLTSTSRLAYVCWDLMAGMRVAVENLGLDPKRVRCVASTHDEAGGVVRLEIDDAVPIQRAVTRFVQCGLNDDVATAAVILNTIPVDDLDTFIKALLTNLVAVLRQSRPQGCGGRG